MQIFQTILQFNKTYMNIYTHANMNLQRFKFEINKVNESGNTLSAHNNLSTNVKGYRHQ